MSLIDKKKSALEWAEHNLIGKTFQHKEIGLIRFTKQGVKHSISSGINDAKITFVYELPKILKRSILISVEKDRKGRVQITTVYKLFVNWFYKGNEYFVYIVIRKGINGVIYYDHVTIKKH
jgi:hypothetical protein